MIIFSPRPFIKNHSNILSLYGQTFLGHSRMILDMVVTPKMFFTSSTDLTVRAWVYEFEESVRVFKGHQHSIGSILFVGGNRKLGLNCVHPPCASPHSEVTILGPPRLP